MIFCILLHLSHKNEVKMKIKKCLFDAAHISWTIFKKNIFSKHEEIFKLRSKAGRFISKSDWLVQLHHGLS
jgi:hypothetical protein